MKQTTPPPFSFHCIICFEAFHLIDRPPVILPCGHTYLCEGCSKQIKRCMECRASLFVPQPQQRSLPPPPSQMSNRRIATIGTRYNQNWSSAPSTTNIVSPKKTLRSAEIRLPIAKNLVLMTLMELSSFSASGEGDTEDSLVIDGIESLRGQSGTYIVKAKRGLVIYPQNPYLHKTLEHDPKKASDSFRTTDSKGELQVIEYGQRVQIANRVDGVFQLARNRGFLTASDSQLVKVGAPLEKCCKLEGILHPLTKSKRLLQEKLERVIIAESRINRQLSTELSLPESHPIITDNSIGNEFELTDNNSIGIEVEPKPKTPMKENRRSRIGLPETTIVDKENTSVAMNINTTTVPNAVTTPQKPKLRTENHTAAAAGSGLARTPPNTNVSTKNHDAVNDGSGARKQPRPNTSFDTADGSSSCGGARRSPPNTNLNFRTGLSGHLALQSAAKLGKREPSKHRSDFFITNETSRGIRGRINCTSSFDNSYYLCSGIQNVAATVEDLRIGLPEFPIVTTKETTNRIVVGGDASGAGAGRTRTQLPNANLNVNNNVIVGGRRISSLPSLRLDFRTGLSGHLGLGSSANLEKRLPAKNRSELFMMSHLPA